MENETFLVYMHTCNLNGKKYVGMTSKTLEERSKKYGNGYRQNKEFITDIKKYGWDNFQHEILEEKLTLEEAKERERYYIKEFNTQNTDFGYNTRPGGDCPPEGIKRSEETKNKISKSLTGTQLQEETKNKISESLKGKYVGENAPWFGKHISEESKKKKSESMKGRHKYTNGEIIIMAFGCPEGFVRYTLNEESKEKLSKLTKGRHYYNNGEFEIMAFECPEGFTTGRLINEESKKKKSESMKGNQINTGRHWYTNGEISIKAYECPEGFTPGRLYRPRHKRK